MSAGSARTTRTPATPDPGCSPSATASAARPAATSRPARPIQQLRRLDVQPEDDDLLAAVAGAIHRAHDRIGELVEHDPALNGTSTTATVALFDGHRLGIGHVGDSRAYLLRDGAISQLTNDHTFVQTPHRRGPDHRGGGAHPPAPQPHPQGRRRRPRDRARPLLRRAGPRRPRPALQRRRERRRSTNGRLADILATGTPDFAAVELVRAALEAGSTDNVTCLVADVVPGHPDRRGPPAAAGRRRRRAAPQDPARRPQHRPQAGRPVPRPPLRRHRRARAGARPPGGGRLRDRQGPGRPRGRPLRPRRPPAVRLDAPDHGAWSPSSACSSPAPGSASGGPSSSTTSARTTAWSPSSAASTPTCSATTSPRRTRAPTCSSASSPASTPTACAEGMDSGSLAEAKDTVTPSLRAGRDQRRIGQRAVSCR